LLENGCIPGMTEFSAAIDTATTEEALDALGLRWRSGKFVARVGQASFGLHLDAGRIIFATSTQRSLRLGHFLLRLGVVRPSFLDDVLQGARVLSKSATLGRVLLREGAITRADLASGVEEQCIEVLARMIDSPCAAFIHVADDPLPAQIEIVPLETEHVFRAAAIRSDNHAAIRAMQFLLPEPEEILTSISRAGQSASSMTEIELLVVVSVERGLNRLVDLCSHLPIDPLTVKRTVIGLLERGHMMRSHRPA